MNLNIDLSKLNNAILRHFYPLLTNKDIHLLLMGGAGSGKSVFAVQKILIRILVGYLTNTVHNQLVIMKTEKSMTDTVIKEFRRWIEKWELSDLCIIHKSPKEILFNNGSRIFFLGCDQPDKLLSLSGVTSIWIEEASRITLNDFEIIDTRLRGVENTYPQIMLSFNPISKLNWIYNHFYMNVREGATLHHSVLKDNYLLNDDAYKNRIKGYEHTNINKYKTFWLGEWGSLEGVIYDNFDIIDNFPENFDESIYGLDFGFNHPNALVKINIRDGEYYLEEKLYNNKLTPPILIDRMKEAIPREERDGAIIYADSSRPDLIMLLNTNGFNCYAANKEVMEGISYCQGKKLHIHKDSYNLIKEIEGYVWMTDKNGNSLEKPLKDKDDLCDSMRYGIFTYHKNKLLRPDFITYPD